MASVAFDFKFDGGIGRDIVYSSLNHSFGRTAGTVSSINSLKQYIYDNPVLFEGMTVEEDKTTCGVTDVDIAKPTNREISVDYYRMAAKRCNIELIYDTDGDYTFYVDKNSSGMSALPQYSGREARVMNLMQRGMAVDNFRRLWFADSGNTGSFYDVEMNGLMSEIIDNSATSPSFDKCFESAKLASVLTGTNTIAVLKELYEDSFLQLRMLLPNEKVFLVTPKVYYSVLAYLEALTGSDLNFVFIQESNLLKYRGVELRMVPEWEQALAGTGTLALDLATESKEFIAYTAKNNIWGVTDNENDKTFLKTFYDEKDEQYYYRGRYALGTYIIEYGMTSFARQALV